jgi:hypothetical protein
MVQHFAARTCDALRLQRRAPFAGADCVRFVEILPRLFEACKMEQRARFAPIIIQNIPSQK